MKMSDAVVDMTDKTDSAVMSKSSAVGGGPDPEDPNEKEKDFKIENTANMKVSEEAVHSITDGARKKQADFVAMYEEIRQKIEKNYG